MATLALCASGCSGDDSGAEASDLAASPAVALPDAATPLDRDLVDMMGPVGIPGLQTVVVKGGDVVWDSAYGKAVIAPLPEAVMTPDSILNIASISKMLVAIACMQQVEAGTLSLDADIDGVLPWPVRHPDYPDDPITWRMLLSHTASLHDDRFADEASYVYGTDHPQPLGDFMAQLFSPGGSYRVDGTFKSARPGTAFEYSNYGVALAAYGVERIVGQPFHEYVREHIIEPLGMERSSYFMADLPEELMAVSYGCNRGIDGRFVCLPFGTGDTVLSHQYSYPDYPAKGMRTSARQYAKLIEMMMADGVTEGTALLQPTSIEQMLTPGPVQDNPFVAFGLGFYQFLDQPTVYGHDGQNDGITTTAFFDRAAGVGALAFGNSGGDDANSEQMIRIAYRLLDEFR
jgi:CubicO group peptidase (beta-lactamase class C family)